MLRRLIHVPIRVTPEPTDRGTALMLLPAAVLVVVVFGAIAVDHSLLLTTRGRLQNIADAAADDAAGLYSQRDRILTGNSRIDCPAATRLINERLSSIRIEGAAAAPEATVTCGTDGRTITVEARLTVSRVIGRALPAGSTDTTVSVRSTGRLVGAR